MNVLFGINKIISHEDVQQDVVSKEWQYISATKKAYVDLVEITFL